MINTAQIALEGLYPNHTTFNTATLGYGNQQIIVAQPPSIVLSFPKFDLPPKRFKRSDDLILQVFGLDNVSFVDFRKKRQILEDELLAQFVLGHNKYKKDKISDDEIIQAFLSVQSSYIQNNKRQLQEEEIIRFFIENILNGEY